MDFDLKRRLSCRAMAKALARKKKVRASHKSSATRMVSKVEEILSGETTDTFKLNQLNMSLKEKLEEIKVLDSDILSLIEDSELENEIAQADLYKERVYSTLILIEKATRPAAVTTVPPPPSTSTTTTARPAPTSTHTNKVRLPKLTIKPFNAKLTAWPPFWDSFKSAIHENPELSKVDLTTCGPWSLTVP